MLVGSITGMVINNNTYMTNGDLPDQMGCRSKFPVIESCLYPPLENHISRHNVHNVHCGLCVRFGGVIPPSTCTSRDRVIAGVACGTNMVGWQDNKKLYASSP